MMLLLHVPSFFFFFFLFFFYIFSLYFVSPCLVAFSSSECMVQQRSGLRQLLASSTLAQQLATPPGERQPVRCSLFLLCFIYSH